MKYLPQIFQGFLMSATLSPELDALKKVLLHSPVLVKLEKMEEQGGKDKKKHDLTQLYLTLPRKDKNLIIFVFLKV
jgi:ATP-dependent RNA helicase DDX56/DBP9